MRAIKFILLLVILGGLALVGYAYLGEMRPEQREITRQIPVPGQASPGTAITPPAAPPAPAQGAGNGN